MGRKPFNAVPIKLGVHHRAKRRRKIATQTLIVAGLFVSAAGVGFLMPTIGDAIAAPRPRYAETAINCRVVDGDTLHCAGGRIRLLAIDAPELPGHCAEGRDCAPGDPFQSSRSLEAGMGGATVAIERVGTDRYGRTLAMVKGEKGDLSCWQLTQGGAIYRASWDNDGRVAKACPEAAR